MEKLNKHIGKRINLTENDKELLEKVFVPIEVNAKSILIESGKIERHLYFLSKGIVKGYKNQNGKIIVEHLIEENNFFTSIDSFTNESASMDSFETVTDCKLFKITKADFDLLKQSDSKWVGFIETVTNESLQCKIERLNDFQTLSAKERYLKFLKRSSNLAQNVSVENIASFLGIEPQSLSRIRRQIIL